MSHDDLDNVLRDLGEREPDAPPFDRVWRAALERRQARRSRRRLARTAAALAVVAALVFVLMPAREAPDEPAPETLELARSLSEWQAPLDFLLEPPGGSLFGFDPGSAALRLPAELSSIKIEEVL